MKTTFSIFILYALTTLSYTKAQDTYKNEVLLGLEAFDKKEYTTALNYCQSIIELDPNHDRALFLRGRIYAETGKIQLAIKDFTQLIEINKLDDASYYARGLAYMELGQVLKAIEDYSKAIEIVPEQPLFYEDRAKAKYEIEDYAGAAEDLRVFIKLQPNNPKAYSSLGSALFKSGNTEDGCYYLKRGRSMGDKSITVDYLISKHCRD